MCPQRMTEEWKALSEEEKKVFVAKSDVEKARYGRERASYLDNKNKAEAHEKAAKAAAKEVNKVIGKKRPPTAPVKGEAAPKAAKKTAPAAAVPVAPAGVKSDKAKAEKPKKVAKKAEAPAKEGAPAQPPAAQDKPAKSKAHVAAPKKVEEKKTAPKKVPAAKKAPVPKKAPVVAIKAEEPPK